MFVSGKCSWFGGPLDHGVAPDEGMAFIHDINQQPFLFLSQQPKGTTGLARRLNPLVNYIACRWDYEKTPSKMLLRRWALVHSKKTGVSLLAFPADWGPHEDTGRVADISLGAMRQLRISTDDIIDVTFPATEELVA